MTRARRASPNCWSVFTIERETRRSGPTQERILRKVALRKEYIEHHPKKHNETWTEATAEPEVLFACDTPRDIHYAERAKRDLDVYLFAATPEQIVRYVVDHARATTENFTGA